MPRFVQWFKRLFGKFIRQVRRLKITAKRSDHSFELDSNGLNQELGGAVSEAIPEIQVQMKKPDINLRIEIRKRCGVFIL